MTLLWTSSTASRSLLSSSFDHLPDVGISGTDRSRHLSRQLCDVRLSATPIFSHLVPCCWTSLDKSEPLNTNGGD